MNSRWIGKLAPLCFGLVLVSASLAACGESGTCKNLRDQTYANKRVWDQCDPGAPEPLLSTQCSIVGGNAKDCTGVLSCTFAVNGLYRDQAEQAVARIGEQSQGCYLCATPDCVQGQIAVCEPISHRCIVVTEIRPIDAGGGRGPDTGTPPDAGAPTTPPDTGVADQ